MMSVPGGISVPPTALAMAMAEAQRLAASVPSAVVVPLTAPAPLSHTPPLATAPSLRPLPLQNATAATPATASMPTVLPIAPPTAAAAAAATTPQQPEEGIAPFVTKLFELVNDPSTQSLISWSEEHARQAFVVWDPVEFSASVLPRFFKHSNFCSFVRQLNIYGFHKVDSKEGYCFQHENFRADNPGLLRSIQRRKPMHKKPSIGALTLAPPILSMGGYSFNPSTAMSLGLQQLAAAAASSSSSAQASSSSSSCAMDTAAQTPGSPQDQQQQQQQQQQQLSGDNSMLYKCLLGEITKLQRQNGETQGTIIQLKEVLMQSRAREEQLEQRLQKIADFLLRYQMTPAMRQQATGVLGPEMQQAPSAPAPPQPQMQVQSPPQRDSPQWVDYFSSPPTGPAPAPPPGDQ